MDDSNTIRNGSGVLANRGNRYLSESSLRGRRKDPGGRAVDANKRQKRTKDPSFSVKVSRRVNYARRQLFSKLGLYTQEELAPLGLFFDCFA